jgi:hypothetical protein
MKQKIPKEVEDPWKESVDGWKKLKEQREKEYYDDRQKIYDVWTRQSNGGYPPPIKKGFFGAPFFCPSCGVRLDIKECIVGTIAVCPHCEYSYLKVSPFQASIFIRLMDNLDANKKGKNTEPVY